MFIKANGLRLLRHYHKSLFTRINEKKKLKILNGPLKIFALHFYGSIYFTLHLIKNKNILLLEKVLKSGNLLELFPVGLDKLK